jgi:hypothetical protein
MTRLAFVLGLLALGFVSTTPARADFAVIEFNSGYCRIWTDTAFGPEDGRYLWFWSPWGWMYSFPTWEAADMAMHRAVAHHRCYHWW